RVDLEAEVEFAVAVGVGGLDRGEVRGLEGGRKIAKNSRDGGPARLRCATDREGRYQLLHGGHVGTGVGRSAGRVQLGGLDRLVAVGIDQVEERVELVEARVEVHHRDARLHADADVQRDIQFSGRAEFRDADQTEAL